MSCICKGFSAHWNLDCNLQVWYAKRVGLIRRFLYYHVAASLILESAKGSLQWISMTIYSDFARCCLQNFVCIPCHACNSGTTLEITIRSDQQTKLGVGHVFSCGKSTYNEYSGCWYWSLANHRGLTHCKCGLLGHAVLHKFP
jgi:hypothetical protein